MLVNCLYDKLIPISELKSHPKNRNEHPKEQIERLAKILKYQGWRYPIKVSKRSGFITSGHGRIESARLNKWKQVPVNFQDYESDEQEYADVQADNAIASWSELDIADINSDIGELGSDFDIDLLGIKDLITDTTESFVKEVNKGDENSEWVDMPEFNPADAYIKLIITFASESSRENFVKDHEITIDRKMNNQWIANHSNTPSI